MKHLVVLACLLMPATASFAQSGRIETMPLGQYRCELPGDVLGPAGVHVPEDDFDIVSASSYRVGDTLGSYLLRGDRLVMTSGPFVGKQFRRRSWGQLRQLEADGSDGKLRCVRRMRSE